MVKIRMKKLFTIKELQDNVRNGIFKGSRKSKSQELHYSVRMHFSFLPFHTLLRRFINFIWFHQCDSR